jgi:hypothetical protein
MNLSFIESHTLRRLVDLNIKNNASYPVPPVPMFAPAPVPAPSSYVPVQVMPVC